MLVMLLISSQVNSSSPVGREGQDCDGTWGRSDSYEVAARSAGGQPLGSVHCPGRTTRQREGTGPGQSEGQANRSSTRESSQS